MKACPTPEKRRFPSAASARAAISGRVSGKRISVYQCDCTWWHQTSRDKTEKGIR